MVYDVLLMLAVMMVVTAFFLPLTRGEAITPQQSGALEYLYRLLLLAIVVGFFGIFWTRRGQTLGMAAWRLKIERADGLPLTWIDVIKRLGAACLSWVPAGAGFFWIVIDREHLAWHDRMTHTRIVVEPKQSTP